MSATTTAINPAVAPVSAPARPAAGPTAPTDDARFDHHLDAARQRHDDSQDKPAREDSGHQPPHKAGPSSTDATAHRRTADAPAKDDGNPDAAAVAAAMLALLGHAVPAKPTTPANAATQAAAKAIAGAQAAAAADATAAVPDTDAAALAAPASADDATAAAKPAVALAAGVFVPLLAKPAEQKDAPSSDALQLANASALSLATPTTSIPASAHTLTVASPAGTPAFAQELGQHIAWLGSQDVKQARIRLHPEDLGTLDVKVSVNHDRVDVSFAVQHPGAVHVVQQTLPQLDTLLAHHGLALGQADVGQRQQHGEGGRGGEATGAVGEIEAEPGIMASLPTATALGMLDTFA